jgi:MFS family permease
LIFLLLCVVNSLGLGLYVVAIAWTAFAVSQNVAVIGHIFLIGSLANLLTAPLIGVLVDRYSRRVIIASGKALTAISLAIPMGVDFLGFALESHHLYAVAILHGLSTTCLAAAMDGLLQQICPRKEIAHRVALVSAVRQASLVMGTAVAGFILYSLEPGPSFVAGSALALLGLGLVTLLPAASQPPRPALRESYLRSLHLGLDFAMRQRRIVLPAFAIAFAFSIAQLTNALLPAYIQREIGATSRLYGLVEAGWAGGGIAGSLLLIPLLAQLRLVQFEYVALGVLGISTLLFAAIEAPMLLIALHAAMGACFSATRILCDSRLLLLCPTEMIGRVRTNVSAMTSLVGVAVYLAPSFIDTTDVRPWYLTAGAAVCLAGILMFAVQASLNARERPPVKAR